MTVIAIESLPEIVSYGDVLANYQPYVDIKNFAIWAFGPEAFYLVDGQEFVDAWNSLHSREFKVYGEDDIVCTTNKMIALWIQRCSCKYV